MEATKQVRGRPEDVNYRGATLPVACVKGDLPLVAMLLAEGAELGLDMLAADNVREGSKSTRQSVSV